MSPGKSSADALSHVLENVLELQAYSDIVRFMAYNRVDTTVDFMVLNKENFQTMKFKDDEEDEEPSFLSQVDIKKLIAVQELYLSIPSRTRQSWFKITADHFEDFIMGNNPFGPDPSTQPAAQTPAPATAQSTAHSQLNEFNKSIKRSTSDYIKLKQNKQWASYYWHLISTAASHRIANTLDSTYVPTTADEIALFKAQNTFLFSVLVATCLTSDSQKHVRKYQSTLDGQKAFQDILAEFNKGKKADVESSNLRTEIETMSLTDKWNKPLQEFLCQ